MIHSGKERVFTIILLVHVQWATYSRTNLYQGKQDKIAKILKERIGPDINITYSHEGKVMIPKEWYNNPAYGIDRYGKHYMRII